MLDDLSSPNVLVGLPILGLVTYVIYIKTRASVGVETTRLRGPPSDHWLFGQTKVTYVAKDSKFHTGEWLEEYGGVFQRPGPFGSTDLCILDPKAMTHILGNSEKTYHIHPMAKAAVENLVGKGVMAADGESHKRQRKNISPGFTTVKIREYTSTFYDCAHKLATQWSSHIEQGDSIIDVQKWFGAFSLDTIGLAGFSHDFGALDEKTSAVGSAFTDLQEGAAGLGDAFVFILQLFFPRIASFPTPRQRAIKKLGVACEHLAKDIIAKAHAEEKGERSVMGLMIKDGSEISQEEITAQIRVLLVAGYETTAATLTWVLIELCRHPDLQERVRAELFASFPVEDPTYEDLTNGAPLLDGLVHETLRLHPPVLEMWRTTECDDVVPLSTPITLPDGSITDKIVVAKGQTLVIPIQAIGHNRTFWGPDAWNFKPERWLSDLPEKAAAISAYRHVLTFADGPKVCLGRSFAVTNMKVALAVLLRKFSFEMLDGPDTKIEELLTAVHRPKEVSMDGLIVRLRVKFID